MRSEAEIRHAIDVCRTLLSVLPTELGPELLAATISALEWASGSDSKDTRSFEKMIKGSTPLHESLKH